MAEADCQARTDHIHRNARLGSRRSAAMTSGIRPKLQGGDRHSQRIEAHAELILSAVAAKSDITLAELRDGLKERGVAVAIGTLWRFFKRRKITRKKVGARRRTAPQRGERGARGVVRRVTRPRSDADRLH